MENTTLTKNQIAVLSHVMRKQQGNLSGYFVTGTGGKDYDDCLALVKVGHMTNQGKHPLCGDEVFLITDSGKAALKLAA